MRPFLAILPDVAARSANEPDLTRYLLVCALLIVVLGVLAYGARRFLVGAVRGRAATRSLQVIDVLPLGGKQRLCVVRCYDRTFALGLGEKEVSVVAELGEEANAKVQAAASSRGSFADLLAAVRGRSADRVNVGAEA